MRNIWVIAFIAIIIVLFGAFFIRGSDNLTTGKSIFSNQQVQVVKLSAENGKYVLTPSTVKKDIPVRIEADMLNMPGCSKSIVIPSFNVKKSFNSEDNIVEFTPDKAGTFNIMCSMNMYKGTFTVLESDGTKSSYVEKAATTSGGTGGGCGCGG
jgi:plastocyanin domain-containing protein